jgi:phosphotransferase system enzyme I (PtsI)
MINLGKIKLRGIGVSSGIAIGHVRLFQFATPLDIEETIIPQSQIKTEIIRFEQAINKTRQALQELGERVTQRGEDKALSEVLMMHMLLLEDRMVTDQTKQLIESRFYSAEYALTVTVKEIRTKYSTLPDLFRERFKDVEDICRRILDNLLGRETMSLENIEDQCVIVSKDLTPSDTASLRSDKVMGFVTEVGGKTSHTAIIARALEIPAVVGVHSLTRYVRPNDNIIVDGTTGIVIINPPEDEMEEFFDLRTQYKARQSKLFAISELEPVTLDGHRIELAANIEFPEEVELVRKYSAHGVGLYRTEFLFLDRHFLPSEDEQYEHYSTIAENLYPKPVIVRTLDLGGDKFAHALDHVNELNPYLGCRAIRFCLQNPDIFRIQLRAILRASTKKNIKIMYPLVSSISELWEANEFLEKIKNELASEGIAYDEDIKTGAMIEVPSAVMMARDMADSLSFFSIGTNDLIQYTLAVDRGNEKISELYQPLHPAVLRMIAMVVQAGREFSIPVSVCGEMAGDPLTALVLLSLGVEKLSMSPPVLPSVKEIIRAVKLDQLRDFGTELLQYKTYNETRKVLQDAIPKLLQNKKEFINQLIPNSTIGKN